MRTVSRSSYTAVKTEGALLPADLLQRVAEGRDLDGLRPEDYHLLPGERLNEAANRAWNRCLGAWQSFQAQRARLPEEDSGVTLTRERWLLVLLQELGYGRLPYRGRLQVSAAGDGGSGGGESYPISHEWERTPIHLVSCRQALDRRDPAAGRSPHSLLQEFLNRSDDHLWGVLSNGLRLRVLRDNVSLTRAAYLEFDLEAMMEGELYADFALLWLVCHESRVEPLPPEDGASAGACWLEHWSQSAAEEGTRALDALRDGVQEAIAALGRGFLSHPANRALVADLKSGALSTQDYYRQLLRLVYRLIFLFVAEDRDLLLLPGTGPATVRRYERFYSTRRLRELAETRRGGPHPDLYRALRLVCEKLREGYAPLGLPALGSYLFSDRSTPDLDGAELANTDLLSAVRALAFAVEGNVRRPVDYRNLGSEELGSVYESLLELHPRLNADAGTFALDVAAGSERKTTGSYYTPGSLIGCLLDSALEPVVEDRLGEAERTGRSAEDAVLEIKVVDPACGSGHFLIAAAHRLARHLARARTGDAEPAPAELRNALRDVVRRCIHGVDVNPMAVELCKVALWMETLDPGKPLSFLDRNIQCGNSLIGVTPDLDIAEVPDDAFRGVTGDHKATASALRRRNRSERRGEMNFLRELFTAEAERLPAELEERLTEVEAIDEDDLQDVALKALYYEDYLASPAYRRKRDEYDLWTSAFFWPIPEGDADLMLAPTQAELDQRRQYATEGDPLIRRARQIGDENQFLHWELAFPTVFGRSQPGFDVVLGNPPWERIKLQEKEWFAARRPDIAEAPNAAARRRMIAALEREDPALFAAFQQDRANAENGSSYVRNSGAFPLCGRGDVNTYALFAELARHLQSPIGRVGIIVPSGIATDDTTKFYFQDLLDHSALVSLYDFENRRGIFPGVHRSYKFCLLTLAGSHRPATQGAEFVFFAQQVADLKESERRFTLTAEEIALLNPNTRTCPIFRSRRDAELTKGIYRRVPVLVKEGPPQENPWGIQFLRMLDMTNDSHLFRTRVQLETEGWHLSGNRFVRDGEVYLPLYEAKLLHHFDHRWATYEGTDIRDVALMEKCDPAFEVLPRYWVQKEEVDSRLGIFTSDWLIGFRDITNTTNERTAIVGILPRVGVGHTAPLVSFRVAEQREGILLVCNVNSFVLDYAARQKVGGTHLTYGYLKQLPVLPPDAYERTCEYSASHTTIQGFLLPRGLELTYTAWDLQPFARDCGYDGPPFRWDEGRRFLLRCELDAAYFHLYGIARDDVAYIMDTFPIVKRRDESAYGEYRTERVILEIYDEMACAMEAGEPYRTRLDPPPADPGVAHPPREEC